MSNKVPLKQILREQDAFFTTSERIYSFFLTYKKKILLSALVIVVIVLAIVLFISHRNSTRQKASEAYYEAIVENDPQATLANMEAVRQEWENTPAARLAAFSMVESYVALGRYEEGRDLLAELLRDLKEPEESLRPLINSYLGALYEETGDMPNALSSYKASYDWLVANSPGTTEQSGAPDFSVIFRTNLLSAMARVNLAMGNFEAARTNYVEMGLILPDTLTTTLAEFKLGTMPGAEPSTAPEATGDTGGSSQAPE
ncbi:MAG: tetratricopeptide repeat protein, partial [Deltaproteobacteria bacterium]|nr:tetratricopeptide repeat protein [Deltaproteobacteria bacterium]